MGVNINSPGGAALISGGLDVGGSIFQAIASGKMNHETLAAQLGRDKADAIMAMYTANQRGATDQAQNQRLGFQQAGELMGGPLDIQKARQQMATKRAFLFGGPGGRPQYVQPASATAQHYANIGALPDFSSAQPFFSDQAMASAEKPFWSNIAGSTEGRVSPDLNQAGYQGANGTQSEVDKIAQQFRLEADQKSQAGAANSASTQNAVLQALGAGVPETHKNGPGMWNKIGRVAATVAPIAAAFIPGVGPIASMAIGAASGAARSKLSGGSIKDMALGAALGGGSSYVGGKLMPGPSGYVGKDIGKVASRVGRLG